MKIKLFTITLLLLLEIILVQSLWAENFYSLQMRTGRHQHAELEQTLALPQVHQETFAPNEYYIYLGRFDSHAKADEKLQQLLQQIGDPLRSYQPMVVELFASAPLTKPQKPQKNQTAAPSQNSQIYESNQIGTKPEATVGAAKKAPAGNKISDPIYTIALAAFSQQNTFVTFIEKYQNNKLYCREKNNGFNATYWGIYGSYQKAQEDRASITHIKGVKPYIVKFNDNDLRRCEL